jgi:hypothetical protein
MSNHSSSKFLQKLHRDERGSISILTVFTVLILTILLGMVMNVGRHVDGKVRMQNAADAAAYSGGVVLAREMNCLTFTNHLLCDVFALTAFMREGRDCNAAQYTPQILDAWMTIAPTFSRSQIPKFQRLGNAIQQKVPLERELVAAYCRWAMASSERVLPVLEAILKPTPPAEGQTEVDGLIPRFQRDVTMVYPDIAQMAANEAARRGGTPDFGRGTMVGCLWHADGVPFGNGYEYSDPNHPVIDPLRDPSLDGGAWVSLARSGRKQWAEQYLHDWNAEMLLGFDNFAKMSQFGNLWRAFTCAQLRKLLEVEHPNTNLPHVMRPYPESQSDKNNYLDRYFDVVAVVYWRKLPEFAPRVFRNPIDGDALAFAQARVYIPQARLVWRYAGPGSGGPSSIPLGGVPGDIASIDPEPPSQQPTPDPNRRGRWYVGREPVATDWNLWNQRWATQLTPATAPQLAAILATAPPTEEFHALGLTLPRFNRLDSHDMQQINTH